MGLSRREKQAGAGEQERTDRKEKEKKEIEGTETDRGAAELQRDGVHVFES